MLRIALKKNNNINILFMYGTMYSTGALNRGLFFADPPLSLSGAVSGKISEIR